MNNKVLYVIAARHTQTDDNLNCILTSQRDTLLNSQGVVEATLLAAKLGDKNLVAIVSSDLGRAVAVAKKIAAYHPHAPFSVDSRLREVDVGERAGLLRKLADKKFPQSRCRTPHHNFDYSPIGGENKITVVRRQLAVFRNLYAAYAGSNRPVAVVGHGSSLQTVLPYLGCEQPVAAQGCYVEFAVTEIPSDQEIA